uniref:Myosin motor domain-containing protein n=1 Tax=Amazona collaria TaxID=241587 RepID=A0A8B9FSS7_9PSIT
MAISSRLALCSCQQIRDEDRGPPPAAPPLLLSVIPGGFIKQLVRETEKEAKAAKLRRGGASGKEEVRGALASRGVPICPQPEQGLGDWGQVHAATCSHRLCLERAAQGWGSVSRAVLSMSVPRGAGSGSGSGSCALSLSDPAPLLPLQPVAADSGAGAGISSAAGAEGTKDGRALPNGLQAEGPGGKGVTPPTHKELPPGRAAPGPIHSKAASPAPSLTAAAPKPAETPRLEAPKAAQPSCPKRSPPDPHPGGSPQPQTPTSAAPELVETPRPEAPKAVKPLCPEKSPKDPCPGGIPQPSAPAPSKGPQCSSKAPAKGRDTAKVSECTKKGAPLSRAEPPGKAGAKRELGPARKELEKMKKEAGDGKKEPRETKKPGKCASKSEGPKEELGGTQERSKDVAKEVGKVKEELGEGKEAPGESEETGESTDKDQVRHRGPAGCLPGAWALMLFPRVTHGAMQAEERIAPAGSLLSSLQAPRDVWYEAEKVWLVQEDGFTLATQLKPDVGTPELPAGRVRVRRDADGSVTEVDEDSVQRSNPPSLDLAEDLAALLSLNSCSAMNTLQQRYRARLPCTFAGPSLVSIRDSGTDSGTAGRAPKGKRDMPPHICSVAQRAYRSLLLQRQDQAIVPLGRSGAGRTSCCRKALEFLVGSAGSVDGRVSVEKIQAMFTVLGAFGSVTTGHSSSSTRFSMVLSLDFSATGQITAAHLQTMLLERGRVAQQPPGESSFNVFPLMLAGLDAAQRWV